MRSEKTAAALRHIVTTALVQCTVTAAAYCSGLIIMCRNYLLPVTILCQDVESARLLLQLGYRPTVGMLTREAFQQTRL